MVAGAFQAGSNRDSELTKQLREVWEPERAFAEFKHGMYRETRSRLFDADPDAMDQLLIRFSMPTC